MEYNKRYLLKTLVNARGYMPQKGVAERMGVSQSVISKIEAGTREPTATELWKLATLYKKPLSYFFAEEKIRPLFITEEVVVWHIDHYGYKLLVSRKVNAAKFQISLEETILAVLQWFSSPRLLESLPVLLYLNDVDTDELYGSAIKEGLQNKLGFIVSVAMECVNIQELSRLRKKLEWMKLAREESFNEHIDEMSEATLDYLRRTRDPLTAKWNLLDRLYSVDFKEIFKHAILAKT